MPGSKSNVTLEEATQQFRKQVLDSYDLEEDFIKKLCDYFTASASPLVGSATKSTASASKAANKERPKRRKSAYNLYVREMMKTAEIQELDHKEKMSAIAKQWKTLSADERVEYSDMATNENAAAAGEAAGAADEE